MTTIQAGIEIQASTSGIEQINQISDAIDKAGISTDELRQKSATLAQQWQRVNETQNLIDSYETLKTSLYDVAQQMGETRNKMRTLQAAMQNGGTVAQQKEYQILNNQLKSLGKQQTKLQQTFNQTSKALAQSGIGIRNLALAQKELSNESAILQQRLDTLNNEANQLKALADARITLGIDSDINAKKQIEETQKAYELLKQSGTLSQAELARAAQLHNHKIYELESKLRDLRPSLEDIGKEVSNVVTRAGGLAYVAKEAISFESAMAGVKKVVSGTPEQISELESHLKDLSVQLAIMPAEMAAIAQQGGQLGIAIEQLPQFAQLAAKMSLAFNMSAEEAGKAAATLSNVFQIPMDDVGALSDAINVLGNNTAAQEKDIISAMMRIGGNAKQFRLTAAEAAALADTFIALGKPPEVAATSINALLSKLQTAQLQGKGFQEGLATIGLTADEMAAQIQANPQQALSSFLKQLESLDQQSRALVLGQMFGIEYSDDIALLVGSLGEYEKALNLVGDASKTAGAMQAEVNNALDTTQAKLNSAKSAISSAASSLGSALLPAISTAANVAKDFSDGIGAISKQFPMLTQLAMLYGSLKVGVMAYEAAMRLTGQSNQTSMLKTKHSIKEVKKALHETTTATKQLGKELKNIRSDEMDFEKASTSLKTLSHHLKTAAQSVIAFTGAYQAGKSFGAGLYENSEAVRQFGDDLARIRAMLHSLWHTGSLDQYRENFRTSAESARELAQAEKEAAKAAQERQLAQAKAHEETANQLLALRTQYQLLQNEQQAAQNGLNRLAQEGITSGVLFDSLNDTIARTSEQMDALKQKIGDAGNQLAKTASNEAKTALQELGLTAEQLQTGISENAEKIIANFSIAAQAYGSDADKIGVMFQTALSKIHSPQEIALLKQSLSEVGEKAGLTAQEIAKIGDIAPPTADKVAQAFAKIGVDTEEITQGISEKARLAFADFQTASQTAAEQGINDARLIRAGFEQMMSKLSSRQEFEAFKQQLIQSGDVAKLSSEQIKRLNIAISHGAKESKTAYEALAQSIKEIANETDVQKMQTAAQTAFEQGEISASQYDGILAQIKTRTESLAQTSAQAGEIASTAHQQATQAAHAHAQAEQKVAQASEQSNEAVAKSAKQASIQVRMAKEETDALRQSLRHASGTFGSGMRLLTNRFNFIEQWRKDLSDAKKMIDELKQATSDGTASQQMLERAVGATQGRFNRLDKTTLNNLKQAIAEAQNQLNQMRQDASDTVASLEAELASLHGDNSKAAQLEQERKLRELNIKLSEAQARQDTQSIAKYREAMDLQERIYREQRARAEMEQIATQNEVSTAPVNIKLPDAPQIDVGNLDLSAITEQLSARDKSLVEQVKTALVRELQQQLAAQR